MIKPQNLLLIDIETVPRYKSYQELSDQMKLLWNKKSLLIDKENIDFEKSYNEKAGIYAEFGKIICIGLGFIEKKSNGYSLHLKSLFNDDEKEILNEFSTICNKHFNTSDKLFCGHNIREFDIPYICRRYFVNQIKLPHILMDLQNKKPWENQFLDTLQFWKFGEYKNFVSVELLAAILEIENPKSDIDGSEVANVYWQQNDLKRIAEYCNRDVITIAQLLMRLHNMPLLKTENIEIK